jgi:predicted enzyme related to lactoylglutathione lyase
MLLSSLNLVVLKSDDVPQLLKFYQELGLKFDQRRHGAAPAHHSAMVGEVALQIYPAGSMTTKSTNVRIGFTTEKINRAVDVAQKAGAKVLSEPTDSPWGTKAVVADPDGNKIEFLQKAL